MDNKKTNKNYVLITPARNEQDYIEETIKSVIAQTVLPQKWIVISDGSTDNTEKIIDKYLSDHKWIELVTLDINRERNFAAKADAINAGIERIKNIDYNFICILDADVSFVSDYFEYLLSQFDKDPKLGLAGTDYTEGKFHSANDSRMSEKHVNGACQMFRRECWEKIGGYTPIKGGGIDWVAVMKARMDGWNTRSFKERIFNHLRPIGTAEANKIISRFTYGKKDYYLGGHPLWELFRGLYSMTKKPYIIGGLVIMLGYAWAWVSRVKKPVPKELIKFHRKEQMQRLKTMIGFKTT